MKYPELPRCPCEMHELAAEGPAPPEALRDPFAFLPAPVDMTPEVAVIADRYLSHDIDWRCVLCGSLPCRPKRAHPEVDDRFAAS